MSKLLLLFHVFVFFGTFAAWFILPHPLHVVSLMMICICIYLIVFNLKRREILPSMFIIVMTETVKSVVAFFMADQRLYHMIAYLVSLMLVCVGQSYLLFRFHANPKIQQLFGAEFLRSYIPQVFAICMMSIWSAAIFGAMLVEVLLFAYDSEIFSGPPFFFRNVDVLTSIATGISIVALWSMMLDAHYLKERLEKISRTPFNS